MRALRANSKALSGVDRAQVDAGDFLDAASGSRDWPSTRWQDESPEQGVAYGSSS